MILWKKGMAKLNQPNLLHNPRRNVIPKHRSSEKHRVDPVQHAAVARQYGSRILYARAALDERLHQIAELGGDIENNRQENDRAHGWPLEPEKTALAFNHTRT